MFLLALCHLVTFRLIERRIFYSDGIAGRPNFIPRNCVSALRGNQSDDERSSVPQRPSINRARLMGDSSRLASLWAGDLEGLFTMAYSTWRGPGESFIRGNRAPKLLRDLIIKSKILSRGLSNIMEITGWTLRLSQSRLRKTLHS